jgi:hypothetical protein
VVNLKNNKITDVGSLPAAWLQLERLYLGSNLLTTIPFEIGACVQVKELDFSWYERVGNLCCCLCWFCAAGGASLCCMFLLCCFLLEYFASVE